MKVEIEERKIPALIRSGKDQEVIPWFYKTIFPKVKKYIVSHGGIRDDAYDVFQDALLYLYNKIMSNEFNEEKYMVGGLLYRLSINRWLNKLKKDKKTLPMDDVSNEYLEKYNDKAFESIELVKNEENLLRKLFSGLGEKCIELLHYTIYYDMLMEDIAQRLSFSSVGAAKMQYKRCKEKLNEEIAQKPELLSRLMNE